MTKNKELYCSSEPPSKPALSEVERAQDELRKARTPLLEPIIIFSRGR